MILWLASTNPDAPKVIVLKRSGLDPLTRIQGHALASSFDFSALSGSYGHLLTTREGVEYQVDWLIPDEYFFPVKLARLEPDDSAGEALRIGPALAARFSLPLTPEFFKFFSHPDIVNGKMLKVEVQGDVNKGSLIPTLTLPLKSGKAFIAKRPTSYSLSPDALAHATLFGFALWPDFYSQEWQQNMALFRGPSKVGDSKFCAGPLFSGGGTQNLSEVSGHQNEIRIWNCNKPPIGFTLTSDGQSSGVILRDTVAEARPAVSNRRWRVFVDFGTANTHISYQEDDGKIASLSIPPRVKNLNKSAVEFLKDFVAPPYELSLPGCSFCYKSDVVTVIDHNGQQNIQQFVQRFEYLHADWKNLVSNLKWGGNQPAMQAYLKNIARLVLAEARARGVQTVRFKWSYPLSLPESSKLGMEAFWRSLTADFVGCVTNLHLGDPFAETPNVSGVVDGQSGEQKVSESEAACRALAWESTAEVGVNTSGLCLVLDVGGGSTDFAFWSSGNLLDYFSIKLAGNDVLSGELQGRGLPFTKLIYQLATGSDSPPEKPDKEADRNVHEMWANWTLARAKDGSGKPFLGNAWVNHPAVTRIFGGDPLAPCLKEIRSLAYLLFGGISYFAGVRSRSFKTAQPWVHMVFTGRGSCLLPWVSNSGSALQDFLLDFFRAGRNQPDTDADNSAPQKIVIRGAALGNLQRPLVKTEVAHGGLERPAGLVAPVQPPIIGERNWLPNNSSNTSPYAWNKQLTFEEMNSLEPPRETADCYIQSFLTLCVKDPHYWKNLNLDPHWDRLKLTGPRSPNFSIKTCAVVESSSRCLQLN